ncbi:hypothetical protein [Rossellomorea aquimaris]|uniref:hypothetical protein n=1 Tax=Rossellomorea aquimaris TaxID=189382 RepID=UPI0015EFF8E7|nr:hypothetical protein [Rossellomorea aquimaris]
MEKRIHLFLFAFAPNELWVVLFLDNYWMEMSVKKGFEDSGIDRLNEKNQGCTNHQDLNKNLFYLAIKQVVNI